MSEYSEQIVRATNLTQNSEATATDYMSRSHGSQWPRKLQPRKIRTGVLPARARKAVTIRPASCVDSESGLESI